MCTFMYRHVYEKTETGPHVGLQASFPPLSLLSPVLPPNTLPGNPLPAGIIGLIGRQHPVHSGGYLTVISHIPQAIRSQD